MNIGRVNFTGKKPENGMQRAVKLVRKVSTELLGSERARDRLHLQEQYERMKKAGAPKSGFLYQKTGKISKQLPEEKERRTDFYDQVFNAPLDKSLDMLEAHGYLRRDK